MKRMGHRPRIDTNAPQPGEPWQNRRCSAVVVIVVLVVLAVLVVLVVVVVVVAPVRYIACFGHLCIQGSPQTSLFGWSWLLRICSGWCGRAHQLTCTPGGPGYMIKIAPSQSLLMPGICWSVPLRASWPKRPSTRLDFSYVDESTVACRGYPRPRIPWTLCAEGLRELQERANNK